MTILVLGGTGFIGPRVIRRLVERGEEVVCLDLNPNTASFAGMEDHVEVIRGDVTQFEDVMKAVVESKPERLINLAYKLGGPDDDPHFAIRLNILGMDNCFEAARLGEVKRVVYASSLAVNGQQKDYGDRLINEDDPMTGTSQPYPPCAEQKTEKDYRHAAEPEPQQPQRPMHGACRFVKPGERPNDDLLHRTPGGRRRPLANRS